MRRTPPVGGARSDADPIGATPPWHSLPTDVVVGELRTDPEHGLTSTEAARRLREHGPNELTPPRTEHALTRLAREFTSPLVVILLGAVAVTAALQEWVDAAVILAVVVVNALIGFVQESRAVKALDALSRSMTPEATAIRAGERRRVSAAELVPGDLVALQSGDKVPADLRIVRSRELQVDESTLTGETHPVEKQPDPVAADTTLADRHDMAYASTLVSYGQAAGVVVATADDTELGRIAHLLQTVEELETPLTRRIAEFSKVLLAAILLLASVTFVVGLLRGESVFDTFMAAVALAVAAIPEGLPAAMTIVLAIGLNRMARRRAIIRKLPAVETLGSTTVICSDKTGTLTANEMTVQEIVAGGRHWQVTGAGYEADGEVRRTTGDGPAGAAPPVPLDDVSVRACLLAGALCNDTALVRRDDGKLHVEGDPTEAALLVAARKGGLDVRHEQATWPRLDTVPFESQHKYMATLHRHAGAGECAVFVKGAVEAVLPRCSAAMRPDGALAPLDAAAVETAMTDLARRGMRVLALARGDAPTRQGVLDHDDVAAGLVFCGLQGMIDPPRPAAVAAVRTAQRAGITVKMITGDHPITAVAVGEQLGLHVEEDRALTGQDLAAFDDATLCDAVHRVDVFARVTPEQKLRLVEALQRAGQVVAMTGDGVNDAPALKQADIGVAMGHKGTDAAKDAADMVLTDDDFASIEAAVEEGRGVFDNLTKFIVWTLPTNVGEGGVVLAAVLLGVTLPVLPLQILWINMTTAVLLGLMLAFEAKEPGIMSRPPRDPDQPVLTRPLVRRILLVGGLLVIAAFGLSEWLVAQGESEAVARTVAVNVFVMGELAYLHACRSLGGTVREIGVWSNPWVWVGSIAMILLQLAFTYARPFQSVFDTASLDLSHWALVVASSLVIGTAASLQKRLERRRAASAP